LIGVISKAEQLDAVEEFFQLFKTPWEFYRPGAAYSVVIATSGDVCSVNARLLVLYGADAKSIDVQLGVTNRQGLQSPCLTYRDLLIPIYGESVALVGMTALVLAGAEAVGVKVHHAGSTVIRLGYDLFDEIGWLLANPQPIEYAHTPTLDTHISMLRNWILEEGIPLMEIPPAPAGHDFAVCLTHDIDFIGIRDHKFDHTMLGFLYRSTFGSLKSLLRGRISLGRLFETWGAVASLPFVYLGWAEDFWEPFKWYLKAEAGLPSTYFLIPFKHSAGERVPGPHASRRATAYDVGDLKDTTPVLTKAGCELGVHGLDSWHSADKGRAERERVSNVTGQPSLGIRMHWLLNDSKTVEVLEDAGYSYDSTAGYNETIGYRNGTTQVFRPVGARTLLELPMHIQDGALFYPQRLDLTEGQAQERCQPLIDNAVKLGGVLTVLWHDRSHGAERFWGGFYLELLQKLKSLKAWFGAAGQVVNWFRQRREVHFERIETSEGIRARVHYNGVPIEPAFKIRVYTSQSVDGAITDFTDIAWNGKSSAELESQLPAQFATAVANPVLR